MLSRVRYGEVKEFLIDTTDLTLSIKGKPSSQFMIDLYSIAKEIWCKSDMMGYAFPFMEELEHEREAGAVIVQKAKNYIVWGGGNNYDIIPVRTTFSSHPRGVLDLHGGWKWENDGSLDLARKALDIWLLEGNDREE